MRLKINGYETPVVGDENGHINIGGKSKEIEIVFTNQSYYLQDGALAMVIGEMAYTIGINELLAVINGFHGEMLDSNIVRATKQRVTQMPIQSDNPVRGGYKPL